MAESRQQRPHDDERDTGAYAPDPRESGPSSPWAPPPPTHYPTSGPHPYQPGQPGQPPVPPGMGQPPAPAIPQQVRPHEAADHAGPPPPTWPPEQTWQP